MGGVDLCDRYLSYYRIKTRSLKWTFRVMFHFIDLAVVNAYLLSLKIDSRKLVPGKRLSGLLGFKIALAESLMISSDLNDSDENTDSDDDDMPQDGRKTSVPLKEERTRGAKHLPVYVTSRNAKRCRMEGCRAKTRVQCTKCKVMLCFNPVRNCFLTFHE